MNFVIDNLTVKNFMSVGNQTQAVNFSNESLTLVIGSNLDLGGEETGSRNGTGKTTIINALSYAFYGQALSKIKQENLINKINGKNMLVTVEFKKDNNKYRIERGRKPNVLKFYVNNVQVNKKDEKNESQGDSRETQKSIEQLIGMSHIMFEHLLALNTYTKPFLSLGASEQREVIEQLLGITVLSEKAESLKDQIKDTKELIQEETFKIEGIKTANLNVQKGIDSLTTRSTLWETKKKEDIESLSKAILHLQDVDIDAELRLHAETKLWLENFEKIRNLTKQRAILEASMLRADKTVTQYQLELQNIKDKKCPACKQELQNHSHTEMLATVEKNINESTVYLSNVASEYETVSQELAAIGEQPRKPDTFYETETEALSHKNNLLNLTNKLEERLEEKNPYLDQIEDLKKTAIQTIDWTPVNKLTTLKDHQEFLLKLLTNKDSFIRKMIIDQNLTYLNRRLGFYIDKLGLPHKVVFKNDLNVEITQLGQDLDFDNLSRGERNRLILSLSFAFRDVWENLYQNINLLFIDELVDSGLDQAGMENTLTVLTHMTKMFHRDIWLISHREELTGKVDRILRATKESGFTSYDILD